jgi:predicted nuclease of predicted toxin-antitoxin system
MNLLFDQNISFRLIKKISDLYPNARQVRELGLENFSDTEIFEYAKKHNYVIVTFDSDFCDINNLRNYPIKIIWLRIGNTTTINLVNLFRKKFDIIKLFLKEKNGCLEIFETK